jgi:hypothetical protein
VRAGRSCVNSVSVAVIVRNSNCLGIRVSAGHAEGERPLPGGDDVWAGVKINLTPRQVSADISPQGL